MAELEKKELDRLEVIKQVINKELTQKEASEKLKLSERQFRRIYKDFRNNGEETLIHKNKGMPSHNKKIPESTTSEVTDIYLREYPDYNFTHFYEEQGFKFGISFSTIVNIFNAAEIISPVAQHKTIKLYNENMKSAIRDKQITEPQMNLYKQRTQEELERHVRKSTIHYSFGQEVQMDAAFWIWFGTEEIALHLAVDKATKKVLFGWFNYEETTEAYMTVLMGTILNYGIPDKIKTDRRNSFSVNNAKSSKTKLNLTQFGRICEDLEITLLCNSDPLFKPNVERENGTFKRRLKAELRHENITTIEEANKYLNEVFIPKMNKRFSYDVNPNKNIMRENNYSIEELNIIISIRKERTIDNASSLKYLNNYYLPTNIDTGEVMHFNSGTKCIVVNSYDQKLFGIIEDKLYSLFLIEQAGSKDKNSSKNGYKPSKDNPWRKFKIN